MLTIILGIIFTLLICKLILNFSEKHHFRNRIGNFVFTLFMIGFCTSLCIGLLYPLSGFEDWELIDETPLIPIKDNIYLSIDDDLYTYQYESENKLINNQEIIRIKKIRGDIEKNEIPNCKNPVLLQYRKKAKRTIWSFAFTFQDKYIFYVPEGSIEKIQ